MTDLFSASRSVIDIALKVSRVIRKEHRSLFLVGSNSPRQFICDHVTGVFVLFSKGSAFMLVL